ncbi:MAG: hypothetical protein R3E79_02110 [Caldilineaceae bacterium]
MKSTSTIQHHLDYLAGHIGCRMIGTPGNLAAAAYIETVFQEAKLTVQRQRYPCPAWRADRCVLRIGD